MGERPGVIDHLPRAALAVTLTTAATTATLTATGALAPRTAGLVFLTVEVPLALSALALNLWRYSALRTAGRARGAALEELAGTTATRVVRAEVNTYRWLWLWARRRFDGQGPGVQVVGYARGSFVLPLVLAGVGAAEAAAVHIMVPWPWLRWPLLGISAYSLLVLLALVASRAVHPHLVSGSQLILRSGAHTVVTIERTGIAQVRLARQYRHTTAIEVDGHLFLPYQDGSNIDLHLAAPALAQLPTLLARHRRRAVVTTISLHVDEPQAFLDLIAGRQRDPSSATGKR